MENKTENQIALIGIIVSDIESSTKVNSILHEYAQYVVGRMGIPIKQRNLNFISLVIDAPNKVISALSGKLGMVSGVTCKTSVAKT